MKILPKMKKIQCRCNAFITRQLRRVSIFQRLNISFLVLLLGTAVFLTFFSFSKYSAEIICNLERYASMSVQNIQLKVQDIMQEYEEIAVQFYEDEEALGALAENGTVAEETDIFRKNRQIVESKLYRMGHGKKYIKSIQLVAAGIQYHMAEENGYQRGGTIRNLDEFYQSNFYQEAMSRHGYPVWIESAGQNYIFYENEQSVYGLADIITLSVAVYQPETRMFLGVLTMNVDIKAFSEVARGYETYQDSNLFLIGGEGVLTAFNPNIAFPAFPADNDLFAAMQKQKKQVMRTEFEGKKVLLAYENIPGTDLFSVYIADMGILLERTGHTRNLCILVLFGVVIGCFAISYYVTKSISDPVRRLVKVMGKAGDGKWTVRYQNSGNDEITVLGDRFNEMADKTNQLIEQVYLSEIRRQKLQLSWKNAQLDAMLMQINPHFLYNTLDIIRWEAMYEANGESKVTRMIEQFSKLCRMGMKAGGNTISLKESLEHAQVYLEVINFRHQEKVQFLTEVEKKAEICYVPQFMLQPILENAVVHGFHDASKGYVVQISAHVQGNVLHIQVKDNGTGMTKEELEKLQKYIQGEADPEKSIGMVNVNQRIRLFYGEEYGIQIQSREQMGTEVTIILPVKMKSEDMKKLGEEVEEDVSGIDRG